MMTVAEAELVRRAAEKGRSASFCAPSQPLSALHAAHSSSDITMDARAHAAALVQGAQQQTQQAQQQQASSSPRTRLKATHATRRSQSCRVQGSRPPRVRRQESPRTSEPQLELDDDANAAFTRATQEDASYNPFLRKVPSCGRLVTLTPDGGSGEDVDSSPVLRRSASARRPTTRPPTASSPNHSPTPTRVTRPPQNARQAGKKTQALVSRGSRRSATGAAGYLEVKPSGSNEGLDPDSYLLRNFSTTTKGTWRLIGQVRGVGRCCSRDCQVKQTRPNKKQTAIPPHTRIFVKQTEVNTRSDLRGECKQGKLK
ncbi:uncharacterized protein LOC126980291 [Eriocheir sinensis]|uniref:uncharacterized protein LOC126980291 n=1 Tax=Eriocheir sinensis TaxID=95602 RepID=UPI0021C9C9FB|nr:uncharacterized protein LOC126980291 [Eriocheir sinensis]